MTTHELARKLLETEDVMVTVRGYEGGVNEINTIGDSEELCLNTSTEWYYGKHGDCNEYGSNPCSHKKVKAIHLSV